MKNERLRWSILAACFTLIFALSLTAYAASSNFRELLAEVLHLDVEDTHYIGLSDSDNGVTLNIVSSHICKDTAVVLLTFEKDNGKAFGNGMNPNIILCDKKGNNIFESSIAGGIYTKLSEDSKTLFCYYTWNFPSNFSERIVTLTVDELRCNWSEVAGKTWPDELISGNWSVSFELIENKDNTVTVQNPNKSKTVTMCGKELQIDSITMTDMLLIANTTTLSDSGMPVDLLSNVSTASGSYYGVFIQLTYTDGRVSEQKDCCLDRNGNIIAWFPETTSMSEVVKIQVGDVIVKVT
ncbi:MAG: hypothetical protein APF77_13750 [Clostridia bacterium BRH_c25]|nr:MAG: hypothetical protein APF77_13750 [Clostridia bacterium BRH_c25]